MLLTKNCPLLSPSEKQPGTLQPGLIVIGTDAELTNATDYFKFAYRAVNLMLATFIKSFINACNLPFIHPVEHLQLKYTAVYLKYTAV